MYDLIVIGGGPGGSASATYAAKGGKKVLVLEKEHFPRFHIGESLLPYNQRIFEEMGVLPALEAAGFPKKLGAQFHLGNRSKGLKLVFRNGRFTKVTSALQVERSKFDDLLLKHARTCGAEVREGWNVIRHIETEDLIEVQARVVGGETETFKAKYLIDASGRGNFTGNQEGVKVMHPDLKKISVFGHFENVVLDEGTRAGDTVIIRLRDQWFWIIPVSATKTSVGLVMNQADFANAKTTPEEIFDRTVQSTSEMTHRMKMARGVSKIQTTADFSYHNRSLVGKRLLRVGDAAGFLDPIFSSGVYLAMYSGKLAAQAVLASLASGKPEAKKFAHYEKKMFSAMNIYWEMVESFYTTPFMEVFLEPRAKFNLPDTITALLAGELEGGFGMTWRRKLFFGLVKLQTKWPLVPRISFREGAPARGESHI